MDEKPFRYIVAWIQDNLEWCVYREVDLPFPPFPGLRLSGLLADPRMFVTIETVSLDYGDRTCDLWIETPQSFGDEDPPLEYFGPRWRHLTDADAIEGRLHFV